MAEVFNLPSLRLTKEQLDVVRARVTRGPNDAHYPAPEDRLSIDTPGVAIDHQQRRLVIPYQRGDQRAPWHVEDHPNRTGALNNPQLASLLDPEIVSTQSVPLPSDTSEYYSDQGYWLDQYGHPVPSVAVQMLEDPNIGVVTGLGVFWHRGINQTSDLIVAARPTRADPWRIATVDRADGTSDDDTTAFPGGYNNSGEPGALAARRETSEELGLPLTVLGDPESYRKLRTSLLVGAGATAHAVAGNQVFLHVVEGAEAKALLSMPLRASEESHRVGWKSLAELATAKERGTFFTAHLGHLALVKAALEP